MIAICEQRPAKTRPLWWRNQILKREGKEKPRREVPLLAPGQRTLTLDLDGMRT